MSAIKALANNEVIMHKIKFREMKYFSMLFVVVFLPLSWPTTSAHSYEKFLHCLSSSTSMSKVIYTQNNASYSSVLDSSIRNLKFSEPKTPKPLLIVTPLMVSHIQTTIYCSRKYHLQIRIRSGGHDFEGLSYASRVPFVIIDLINFSSVDVDAENEVAWVQSGATLGELYYSIAEKSETLAFPAGVCHTVGVGGHFSGGGYGILFRKFGLAVDNIIDARFINVNGRILDRQSMGEDLFWAIRGGGGGSFGIVLAWKLKLVHVPSALTAFTISKTLEQNATKLVHQWQYIAPKLPHDIFFTVSLRKVNSNHDGKTTILATFNSLFLGAIDELIQLMQHRFPELGLRKEDCIEMSWIESILHSNRIQNGSVNILLDRNYKTTLTIPFFKTKTDYVKEPIPESAFKGIISKLYESETESSGIIFVAYGGKIDEISETATPFPHRAGNLFKIVYNAGWQEEDNVKSGKYLSWIRDFYSYMTAFVSKSPREAYINYRDLDIGFNNNNEDNTSFAEARIWGYKYFKNNFDRLAYVKKMIDPHNFFTHEQSIPPIS